MQKPNPHRRKAGASAHPSNPLQITETIQGHENEVWLDNADVKMLFKISDSTLYRLRKSKQIPFMKLRGKFFYPKHFMNAFMMARLEK